MNVKDGFGAFIRRLREERGLSLRKAARAIAIGHGRLAELEHETSQSTGRPTKPQRALVMRIADAYGIPRDTLLEYAGYARERPDLSPDVQLVVDMMCELDDHYRALAVALVQSVSAAARAVKT